MLVAIKGPGVVSTGNEQSKKDYHQGKNHHQTLGNRAQYPRVGRIKIRDVSEEEERLTSHQ